MGLQSDLTAIKSIQDGVKNNKVTRFAYTQQAYTENDADGHTDYVYARENNIPTDSISVMEVNQTVVDKGFRARASSLTRMLLNHLFGRISYNLNKINDLFNDLLTKIIANMGVADGLATLDATGRIPYSQLPEDAMEYQGEWNAQTNTPTLVDGTGTKGDTYSVSVAGTQTFGGESITFFVNDRVVYNGSVWQRFSAGNVQSVCEIQPDETTGNVDLSKQTDVTKILNNDFLVKLLAYIIVNNWKQSVTLSSKVNNIQVKDNLWVALSAGAGAYKSNDGHNWEQMRTGNFFTSCKQGTMLIIAGMSSAYWSEDEGRTWTTCTYGANVSFNARYGIVYANNKYIMYGSANSYAIAYSSDGKYWQRTTNSISPVVNDLAYFNDIFISVGSTCYWSSDGITWTRTSSSYVPVLGAIGRHAFACSENFIIVGCTDGIAWSNDGKEWVAGTIDSVTLPNKRFVSTFYSKGLWVACSDTPSAGIVYSTDGKNWTTATGDFTDVRFYEVLCAQGCWYATSTVGVWWSTNGKSWQLATALQYASTSLGSNGSTVCAGTDSNGIFYTGLQEALDYINGDA